MCCITLAHEQCLHAVSLSSLGIRLQRRAEWAASADNDVLPVDHRLDPFCFTQVGKVLWATVQRLANFGAFLRPEGGEVDGLLHISAISKERVENVDVCPISFAAWEPMSRGGRLSKHVHEG